MTDLKPGPVLDALVAEKVLGWHIFDHSNVEAGWPPTPFYIPPRDGTGFGGVRMAGEPGKIDRSENVRFWWSPSTSIADAWEVVERLPGTFDLSHYQAEGAQWEARFWLSEEACHEAEATTAPMAICLAALKAVGALPDGAAESRTATRESPEKNPTR